MKHIVTLTISNPAHEHISLRRRQSTTNYMVEARDEAEAIFRASNHFKKLGNYVHNAVIAESTLNEEVEQIDELNAGKGSILDRATKAARSKFKLSDINVRGTGMSKKTRDAHDRYTDLNFKLNQANAAKRAADASGTKYSDEYVSNIKQGKEWHAAVAKVKADRKAASDAKKAAKLAKEEVEQIDELSSGLVRRYGGKAIRAHLTAKAKGDNVTALKRAKGVNLASAKAFPNSYLPSDRAKVPATNEEAKRQAEPPPSAMPSDTRIKPLPKAKKGVRIGSTNKFGHYTPGMKEEVEQIAEKAPPGAKYERMVKHIKNQYSKDGTLTPQEKAIAYATAWKAKNAGK